MELPPGTLFVYSTEDLSISKNTPKEDPLGEAAQVY